jgi:hypothetical protein
MTKSLKEKAINIRGKMYVQVKDRVLYFNETYPNGKIETSIVATPDTDQRVVMLAKVTPDVENPDRYFTGISASNPSKTIEAQVPHEVAETSAVGRALAMMGIGVLDAIASADEIRKVDSSPLKENAVEPTETVPVCEKCGADKFFSQKKQAWYCSKFCWTKKTDIPTQVAPTF